MSASHPDLHGLCVIENDRAVIRITSDSEQVMEESLMHEWCHVLRNECPVPWQSDHDSLYWAIYGQVSEQWWR